MLILSMSSLWSAFSQSVELAEAFPNLSFTRPLFLTHSNDGTNRIFVVQQDGIIHVFPNDSSATSTTIFLNIGNKLSSPIDEEGLLGLAFHPNYATNGYFYVNYTAPNLLRTVVARYSATPGNPDKADSLSEFKIFEINQPFTNHNGGMIEFGPDGYLYVGMGDGGSANDPDNYGQDRTQLLGKMLRIDVSDTTATRHYSIPPDNPYVGNTEGFREEIWAYGLRNPFRFSIDPVTGELWAGDVGQDAREEVDLIEKGKNYGWKYMEGSICRPPTTMCDTVPGLTLPVKDYGRSLGSTVIGGYIYRGYRRPNLLGAYIYADFFSGKIWMLRYQNGQLTSDSLLIDTSYLISSFGTDQDGELYLTNFSFTDPTKIYRFAGNPLTDVRSPESHRPLGGFALHQNFPNPFNPSTTIRYSIPKTALVSLKVFDLLGREVAILVEGVQEPGDYSREFNAENLGRSSGVFFYRLSAGAYTETRTMVLLR